MKISSFMALTCVVMLGLSSSVLGDTSDSTSIQSSSTSTPKVTGLEAVVVPSTAPLPQTQSRENPLPSSSSTHSPKVLSSTPVEQELGATAPTQVLRTVLGFELERGLRYPVELVIQDAIYKELPIGESLIDAIGFKDQNQKKILRIFSIRKISNENFLLVQPTYQITHTTKNHGLFCINSETNKLAYYNGFLLQTDNWKGLNVGEHLIDSLVRTSGSGSNFTFKDEVTFDFEKKANLSENVPILWDVK